MDTISLADISPKNNFQWKFGGPDNQAIILEFVEKKNFPNKFKWWFATKFFLPGTYKWL